MVKERRAFGVKSVEQDIPQVGLRLGGALPVDYSSSIQAQADRTGVYVNPQVFRDLAELSDNIHKYRRTRDTYQFDTRMNVQVNEEELQRYNEELELKRQSADEANRINSEFLTSYLTAKRNASIAGDNFVPILNQLNEDQQKVVDRLYSKAPVVADLVNSYRDQLYKGSLPGAYTQDDNLAKFRIASAFQRDVTINAYDMLSNGTQLPDAIQRVANNVAPNLSELPEDQKDIVFNDHAYNPLFGIFAESLITQVQQGTMGLEEAQQQFELFAAIYDQMDISAPDGTGKTRVFQCYLDPKLVDDYRVKLAKVDNSTNAAKPYISAKEYYKYTGKEYFDKGDILHNPYLVDKTVEQAKQDYLDQRTVILSLGLDSVSTIEKLDELDKYYSDIIFPAVTAIDVCRAALNDANDITLAVSQAIGIANQLQNTINQIDATGEIPANIPELKLGNKTIEIDLTPPLEMGLKTSSLKQYAINRLTKIQETLLKVTTDQNLPGLIKLLNKNVRSAYNSYMSYLTPNLLVSSDSENRIVAKNKIGIADAMQKAEALDNALEAANGTTYTNPIDADMIHTMSSYSKGLGIQQRNAYTEALADVYYSSRQSEAWLRVKADVVLSPEDKKFYRLVSANIILTPLEASSAYIYKINKLRESERIGDLDTNTMLSEIAASSSFFGTRAIDVERKYEEIMVEHGVPEGVRGNMRYAMALADYASLKSDKGQSLSSDQLSDIVKANYSNGIYSNSKSLEGRSAETIQEGVDSANNTLKNTARILKLPKGFEARFDSLTGDYNITLDDRVIWGKGVSPNMPGTDVVPFKIYGSSLPQNISEEERNNLVSHAAVGLTTLAALTHVQDYPQMLKKLKSLGYTPEQIEDIQSQSIQMLDAFSDPVVQKEVFSYLQSNGASLVLDTEGFPVKLENLLVESTKDKFSLTDVFAWTNAAKNKRIDNEERMKSMGRFYNALYARTGNRKKVNVAIPSNIYNLYKNPQSTAVLTRFQAAVGNRLTISSTYLSKPGTHLPNSRHHNALAIDVSSSNFQDVHGNVSKQAEQDILNYIKQNPNDVYKILTSDRELIKRNAHIKNKNGQPIFRYAEDHWDHFHIDFWEPIYDLAPYREAMTNELFSRSKLRGSRGTLSFAEASAIVNLYPSAGYKATQFDADILGGGIKADKLNDDPVLRQLAIAERYKVARTVMGSQDLAILALDPRNKFIVKYKNLPASAKDMPTLDKSYTLEGIYELRKKYTARGITFQIIASTPKPEDKIRQNKAITAFKAVGVKGQKGFPDKPKTMSMPIRGGVYN